ncbi:MAG: DegT/DnrJ/EryC1/StrS family aminotransferase, partial [Deltaproteobacteria bacterium]|nr:DegT/DnrJ/EryC1/StrS family aminotransferase [Deltaproteobacteria bacterium]
CGTRFCAVCSSGTGALHLALAALGIGPGDEVIVPALTMIASGNAVLYTGATPVIADVDAVTGNLDPAEVQRLLSPRTRAVMVVHLYGLPCDMNAIRAACDPVGIPVIEDAAEAIGTTWGAGRAGALGKAGCFSFFANKAITTGEGGAVVTDDPELDRRVRGFRDQWFVPGRRFFHPDTGFNYRMSNLQAAVGVAQLERVGELVEARCQVARIYGELLGGHPDLVLPPDSWPPEDGSAPAAARSSVTPAPGERTCPVGLNSHWMYALRLAGRHADRAEELAVHLKSSNIETRLFFVPLDEQPAFAPFGTRCPVSRSLSRSGILLPTGPLITPAQQARVAEAVKAFLQS